MQKYWGKIAVGGKNNYLSFSDADNNSSNRNYSKNVVIIGLVFIFIIALFYFLPFDRVLCEEKGKEEIEKDLGEKIETELDKLDLSDFDRFIDKLESEVGNLFNGNTKTLLRKIMKGEFVTNFDDFMGFLQYNFKNILYKYIPVFLFVIVIAIINGMMSKLSSGFLKKPTVDIINFVCFSAVIIVLFTALIGIISTVKNVILSIKKLMDISFPILLTLITALGGVVSSSVYQPLMVILANYIIALITAVILPLFISSIILNVVGNMSDAIKLKKLPKLFVSVAEWILGIVFSLFSGFVTVKGIAGATIDNVSISATKFALSSYVPILGGYVSDGFDLVLSSCLLIKNSLGVTVLFLLLLTILVPLIKILVFMLGLKLVSAIIEPICDSKISDMVNGISNGLVTLIISIIGVGFMFFIVVMLIIYTCSFSL